MIKNGEFLAPTTDPATVQHLHSTHATFFVVHADITQKFAWLKSDANAGSTTVVVLNARLVRKPSSTSHAHEIQNAKFNCMYYHDYLFKLWE
jgi:hypothetical protein